MEIRYVTNRFEFESALAELWTIEKLCCDFEATGLDARVHEPRLLQLCSTKEDEEDRVVYVIDLFKCENIDGLKALIESRSMLLFRQLLFKSSRRKKTRN